MCREGEQGGWGADGEGKATVELVVQKRSGGGMEREATSRQREGEAGREREAGRTGREGACRGCLVGRACGGVSATEAALRETAHLLPP